MTGHAAGQGQASPGSSPLHQQPFQKGTNQRLTEEEALDRNPEEEALSASTPS